MRVMVIVKANGDTEGSQLPSEQGLTNMMKYNEELVNAGVMLAGEGLHASAKGKRVRFDGDKRTVIDGPFTESKELVAGFWIWKVKSMDEAIAWVKRMPMDDSTGPEEVEIRPVFETEEFGDVLTPETRAKEAELRQRTANPQ